MEISPLLLPAVALGAALTIDVTIATVSRFRDTTITFFNWALPIALLHIIFIGAGFTFFWELVRRYPLTAPVIGTFGFVLVTLLMYEVAWKARGKIPYLSISKGIATILRVSEDSGRRFIVWIAVTLDALVSGPMTVMLAEFADWSPTEAVVSFLIVGCTVAAITYVAILTSRRIAQARFKSTAPMVRWLAFGTFLEMTVIEGFGILSLWGGYSTDANLTTSVILSGGLSTCFFIIYWSEVNIHQHIEAQETLAGEN